jgi:hypothetical protein
MQFQLRCKTSNHKKKTNQIKKNKLFLLLNSAASMNQMIREEEREVKSRVRFEAAVKRSIRELKNRNGKVVMKQDEIEKMVRIPRKG